MFSDPDGPIEHFSWSKYIVRGIEHSEDEAGHTIGMGKDICLKGESVEEWRERHGHNLTGTMVQAAVDSLPDILIIGQGVQSLLQCEDSIRQYLVSSGINQVICLSTPMVVRGKTNSIDKVPMSCCWLMELADSYSAEAYP